MKLSDVQQTKNFEELKPAIRFLCDNMQTMTFGEFNAYKRTIETQARVLGIAVQEINAYAENHQVYGYEVA